jgi:outer membrane protein assembly factor BamB
MGPFQLEIGIVKPSRILLPVLAILLAATGAVPQATKKEPAGAGDWNQFRGANRDGVSPETGLLKQWPASGPPQAWKATGIGSGYSSVCVSGTRVFTMGDTNGKAQLVALSAADGKILWKTEVGAGGEPPQGQGAGPRGTPATDGTLVFAISQMGDIVCAQAATGRLVWKKTMQSFGGNMPSWGWSESPLLDGNMVVISPGSGSASVVALNKANGAPLWQSKVGKGTAHYTSLAVAEIGGVRQYLYFNNACVAGIAARTGQMAWSMDRPGQTAIASTPVYSGGIVFVSSGYGVGHTAFRVAGAGGRIQAQKAYEGKELESHHGGFVAIEDHVYGPNQGSLVCMEIKTGKVAWQDRCVGKGSAIAVDGHLIVRGEGGGVALVEATPTGYKSKGQFNLPKTGGNGAWANPAVAGGKLFLREWDNLYCYNLKVAP